MLEIIRNKKGVQYLLGLVFGFCFGFLLQRGGVCYYERIVGQLLLDDFTVVKVMLSAIVTGMVGIYAMRSFGWIELHKKGGSVGTSIPGPLIFGMGFALLGYCPGTAVGAVGHGALDALIGGVVGITIGAGIYAAIYPKLKRHILDIGDFGDITFIDLFRVSNPWFVVAPVAALLIAVLYLIERAGL
ncbi:MAG: YeeE/YedE thiosulfate transporter family protein [Planctomycetota bacterium]